MLHRHAVHELIESIDASPDLVRHVRRTAIPSECLFHTLLHPQLGDRLLREDLHFARWDQSAHPAVLTMTDLERIAASERFFARKFDATSGPLLDRIDGDRLNLS